MNALVVFVASSHLLLVAVAQETCCRPHRLQAKRYDVDTRKNFSLAIDFDAKRFYASENLADDEFVIVDINAGTKHAFKDGKCRTTSANINKLMQTRCLHDDLHIPNFRIGTHGNQIDVLGIGFKDGPITRLLTMTDHHGHCLPIMFHTIAEDYVTTTSLFYYVTTSISGSSIRMYSDLSQCEG